MTATIINIAERRRDEPLRALLSQAKDDDGEILYASPPVKDTAPAEYVAPKDDPA